MNYPNKKQVLPVVFYISIVVVSLQFVPATGKDALSNRDGRITSPMFYKAIAEAVKKADEYYYEEIDRKEMYEGAIKGALAALGDPYTYYLPERQQKREKEDLYHSKFGGLGIQIYVDKGLIKIARPLPDSPAIKAGLQAGDYIVKVGDVKLDIGGPGGQTRDDIIDILRGRVGTKVTITIQRRGLREQFDVTLTREEILPKSVRKGMLENQIGYIQISSFTGRTNAEFKTAISQLQDGGMTALILDLRDNAGGLLEQANYVVDAFISEGAIVSTRGREHRFNQEYPAHDSLLCPPDIPLVVMVNEYSASGSEIVAGAIKDTKRGVLVGTDTYGKGLVQQRFPLKNGGGSVSLTISEYFTPSGASIHEKSITPHVVVANRTTETVNVDGSIKEFVEKWIEENEKTAGETPTEADFAVLEGELPELISSLGQEFVANLQKSVRQKARRIFDVNLGIYPLVDLKNDKQLAEAIRILNEGQVESILAAAPTANL
ncbi:MAG: S41 family peptidase [Candidatus Poribacteria bacterium]|nr:S41 family peptidase [Candidatus Poribacteria bacterium]MDE0504919.1 S41 family peptidase [Candidatus Poribacteria bacterium]